MPHTATDDDFAKQVKEGLVLVDFWAAWCAPCHALGPILEEVEKATDDAKLVKLNVDENQQTAMDHRVTAIPTVKLFKDGEIVDELIGLHQKQEYLDLIKKHAK